jgi:hypothetical protein
VKQIRKRLTFANVMSSLAVFLVLGGATAFAASKIGTSQLKANAVTSGKIKKNAVTGAKVKDGSLTAKDLKASVLKPACPQNTKLAEGVCFETTPRAAAAWNDSVDACTAAGGRLPSVNELIGFTRKVQTIPAAERSGDLFLATVAFTVNPDGTPTTATLLTTATPYRCVTAPTP